MPAPNDKPARFFNEVIRRVAAGEQITQVCIDLGVSLRPFRQYANDDPDRARRYAEVVSLSRSRCGTPRADRSEIDALIPSIFARYKAGETLPSICDQHQGVIQSVHVLRKVIAENADHKARFAEAIEYHKRAKYDEAAYDLTLERIATTTESVLHQLPGEVLYQTMQGRARRDVGFRERFDAAKARREMLEGVYRFNDEADYVRILEIVEAKRRSLADAADQIGPTSDAFRGWLKRRPEMRARIDAVVSRRQESDRAAYVPPPTRLTQYELRRPLLENELFRNASALLRMEDSDDADDIRSDMILSMLENRAIDRQKIVSQHFRKVSSRNMVSIDETFGYGNVKPLDNLRTDDILWGA